MSHTVKIKAKLLSLEAIKQTALSMGGTLEEATTYTWWGRYMNDSPLPVGFSEQDMGRCHYKIKFPNVRYEVGIVEIAKLPANHPARKHHDAKEFVPLYDYVDGGLATKMGYARPPSAKNPKGLSHGHAFTVTYIAEQTKLLARKKGAKVKEKVNADGSREIEINT